MSEHIDELIIKYNIIHQTGEGGGEKFRVNCKPGYLCAPFFNTEIPQIYSTADIVVCRAGAGTISELTALEKKAVIIPLKIAQQNEQYFNALEARKKIACVIIEEHNFTWNTLNEALENLLVIPSNKTKISRQNPLDKITEILINYLNI
ncbi:MAG TPA: hypothetical protein DC049_18725 [Spirochaetia bacterium]|nr:hypothetical protein [Spirochaetia bacterium]